MKKRILALILILCMISVPNAFAVSSEDNVGLITALGIMSQTDVKSEKTVTRADFANIFVSFLNLGGGVDSYAGEEFADVNESVYGAAAINYLAGKGVISGYSDGCFYPEKEMTYAEAVTVILREYGYAPAAENMGGYPTGYLRIMSDLSSQSGSADSVLTLKKLGKILGDLLKVNYSGVNNINEENILERNDIYLSEGIVTATSETELYADSGIKADEVKIDDTVYNVGPTDAKHMLGEKIKFYYREDDGGDTLIYILNTKNREMQIVRSTEIDKFENNTYYYTLEETNRSKSAELSATAIILYNGSYVEAPFDKYIPDYGDIRLVDFDGDRKTDVVYIYNYETKAFTKYYDDTVYFSDGTKISVKDEELYTLTDESDIPCNPEDLKENDIVLVGKSQDGKKCILRKSSESAEGTYKGVSDGYYRVGEEEYEVSKNLIYLNNSKPELGSGVTVYFDIYGAVAAVSAAVNTEKQFGYIAKAAVNDEDRLNMKLFCTDGDFHEYLCAEKTKLNGETVPFEHLKNKFIDDLGKVNNQLIVFKLSNKGEIKEITTSSAAAGLIRNSKDGLYQVSSGSYICKAPSNTFSGVIAYDNDTIFFSIPENKKNYEQYAVSKSTNYSTDYTYKLESYVTSLFDIAADVIIHTPQDSEYKKFLMGISDIEMTLNSDESVVYKIDGCTSSGDVVYSFAEGVSADGINRGDVINVLYDTRRNAVTSYDKVYDYKTKTFNRTDFPVKDKMSGTRVSAGDVYYTDGEYAYIAETGAASVMSVTALEPMYLSTFKLFRYDINTKKFEKIPVTDVISYHNSATGYDEMVFSMGSGVNGTAFLFKNQ